MFVTVMALIFSQIFKGSWNTDIRLEGNPSNINQWRQKNQTILQISRQMELLWEEVAEGFPSSSG